MKALELLKHAYKGYSVHERDIKEAIAELEELQSNLSSEYEKGYRDRANREGKSQKSYTIGYAQGYLDCEKNKKPKDIKELIEGNK